jgi:hypothetical protein
MKPEWWEARIHDGRPSAGGFGAVTTVGAPSEAEARRAGRAILVADMGVAPARADLALTCPRDVDTIVSVVDSHVRILIHQAA